MSCRAESLEMVGAGMITLVSSKCGTDALMFPGSRVFTVALTRSPLFSSPLPRVHTYTSSDCSVWQIGWTNSGLIACLLQQGAHMASSSLEWHFCVKSHICLRKGRMGRLTVDWVVSHDSVESAETSKILLARYTDLPELPAAVPQDWKGRDWTLFSGKELLTMESDRLYHAFNQKSKTFEMREFMSICERHLSLFRVNVTQMFRMGSVPRQ